MSYAFQWQRAGTSIAGASSAAYTLGAGDVGSTLNVVVTASNTAGSASATSASTPVVVGASLPAPPPPEQLGLAGFKFIGSIDTMKLSKDRAAGGFTTGDAQAVDLAATTNATHITDDAPLEYPAVLEAWANRIHADGKHVWFRLNAVGGASMAHGDLGDGYPTFAPGYLTTLHDLMVAHPSVFKAGDVLDGDAEAENSGWWSGHYGCGVQQGCTPCNAEGTNKPCSPVGQFNHFLLLMTEQENRDLGGLGCATPTSTGCVLTQVHSTDPGTATHQLSSETVRAMGGLITVDAYPDQSTTDPATAASGWTSALRSWESAWSAKGMAVAILVGEWGYSNTINVTDLQQEEVINAETSAFPAIPFLAGTNYWVGPGNSSDGGYTNILIQESGNWKFRPAAGGVSAFYATMNGELANQLLE
jgi:hypothetical protein